MSYNINSGNILLLIDNFTKVSVDSKNGAFSLFDSETIGGSNIYT